VGQEELPLLPRRHAVTVMMVAMELKDAETSAQAGTGVSRHLHTANGERMVVGNTHRTQNTQPAQPSPGVEAMHGRYFGGACL
jgi:hypothetical protein